MTSKQKEILDRYLRWDKEGEREIYRQDMIDELRFWQSDNEQDKHNDNS